MGNSDRASILRERPLRFFQLHLLWAPYGPASNRQRLLCLSRSRGASLAAFLIGLSRAGYWTASGAAAELALRHAQTMAFVTLSASELFRAYTARSERYSVFSIVVFSNKWMQWAVLGSLLVLLAHAILEGIDAGASAVDVEDDRDDHVVSTGVVEHSFDLAPVGDVESRHVEAGVLDAVGVCGRPGV